MCLLLQLGDVAQGRKIKADAASLTHISRLIAPARRVVQFAGQDLHSVSPKASPKEPRGQNLQATATASQLYNAAPCSPLG